MPIPSEFTPILQSLPLISSEWDEENRTLVLTTSLRYPGTEESLMIFVTEDASIGGWMTGDLPRCSSLTLASRRTLPASRRISRPPTKKMFS